MAKRKDALDWQNMTQAEAIRQASKFLGGERSPTKIARWLAEEHGINVHVPQASKVLKVMYSGPAVDADAIRQGILLVAEVKAYADKHGGVKKLRERLESVADLIELGRRVGGMDTLVAVVEQMAES